MARASLFIPTGNFALKEFANLSGMDCGVVSLYPTPRSHTAAANRFFVTEVSNHIFLLVVGKEGVGYSCSVVLFIASYTSGQMYAIKTSRFAISLACPATLSKKLPGPSPD